jgi:hypothetical protein
MHPLNRHPLKRLPLKLRQKLRLKPLLKRLQSRHRLQTIRRRRKGTGEGENETKT